MNDSSNSIACALKNLTASRAHRRIAAAVQVNIKDARRAESLKRKYGLSVEAWNAMLDSQGGCCAICKSANHRHVNWHTDHCHRTGVVRGILCRDCNHMLGLAKDDTSILEDAIAYLNQPRWQE